MKQDSGISWAKANCLFAASNIGSEGHPAAPTKEDIVCCHTSRHLCKTEPLSLPLAEVRQSLHSWFYIFLSLAAISFLPMLIHLLPTASDSYLFGYNNRARESSRSVPDRARGIVDQRTEFSIPVNWQIRTCSGWDAGLLAYCCDVWLRDHVRVCRAIRRIWRVLLCDRYRAWLLAEGRCPTGILSTQTARRRCTGRSSSSRYFRLGSRILITFSGRAAIFSGCFFYSRRST